MRERQSGTTPIRIAIIGGGFSGTVVLAHLVNQLSHGTSITVFDARGAFGGGTAYSTPEPCHLLNVPADRMGAFEADHFVEWLDGPLGRAAAARICPDRICGAKDYLPRALYGAYLRSILDEACATASHRGIAVTLVPKQAEDVRARGEALEIRVGKRCEQFDILVLATGNCLSRQPAFGLSDLKSKNYIGDVWANGLPDHFPKNATVLIVGTGLTAVDAILSLEARGHEGRIIAVSRHGWLPTVHASERPAPWTWGVPPERIAPRAVAYLHWLKTEARAAQSRGGDWRSIFETLRPMTPKLWRELDDIQQNKVLRRHALWSIHRHRMAPEIAARLDQLRKSGRLEIVAARIGSVRSRFGVWRVRLRRRRAQADEILSPSWIFNCTGPEYDIERSENSLLRRLVRRGIAVRAPNGIGLGITPDGSVRSPMGHSIFALGAVLVGDQFEITAVPELRIAARHLAEQIVREIDAVARPMAASARA